MDKMLYNRIKQIHKIGSKTDKKIADYLCDVLTLEKTPSFSNITTLAECIDVSLSSVHRFVKIGGWLPFKHFYFDFINLENVYVTPEQFEKEEEEISDERKQTLVIEKLAVDIKKPPILFCSRKSGAICSLIGDRISDLGWKPQVFNGNHNDTKSFVSELKNDDVLIMVSVTGYSYLVSETLSQLARKRDGLIPKTILMSVGATDESSKKYIFVTEGIVNKKIECESWTEYNSALSDIVKALMILLNKYYELHSDSNSSS